ncbi:hypothetical protein AAE478_005553 [Parahypoxylon ruwenzoriense]
MARERKRAPAPVRGIQASTRRAKMERAQQYQDHIWRSLNPLKEPPKLKYKTYFESVENMDKKKKLEFKITTDRHPPPGFEFIPIGHPRLSYECKEMSREEEAMIFIVSDAKNPDNLDHHMNRVGYHFRQTIVDQARLNLKEAGKSDRTARAGRPGEPEPIPKDQREIDAQVDAVLRDLFPRIPHTDRRQIIQHAFQKDGKATSVGMAKELTLARRVQLAALAHIRHTHTRYDELLKESDWANARKAVEKPCLGIIVKWRGDEETGRDQLDEILREVIEISDSEEESGDETPGPVHVPAQHASTKSATTSRHQENSQDIRLADHHPATRAHRRDPSIPDFLVSPRHKVITRSERRAARKTQRFRRYAAAAEALAGASHHNDHAYGSSAAPSGSVPMDLTRSPGTAYTIISSREPTIAARDSPNMENLHIRPEMQTNLQYFNSASRRERTVAMSLEPPEVNVYAPSQLAHNPDGYRPKVGLPPTRFDHPQAPLSPGRNGLKDMLVQSIEPASPIDYRESHDASRALIRAPRRFEEAHRVISRDFHEPAGSILHPRSPRGLISGNEVVAKRHVAVYPGEFETHAGPAYVHVNHTGRGEGSRRAPIEYISERPAASSRIADRALSQSWPVSGEEAAQYIDDVPLRTRARPIIIEEDDEVFQMRRYPDDGDSLAPPFRRRELIRGGPIREDTRIQHPPGVVFDDAPARPRSALGSYDGPINPIRRLSPYVEPSAHMEPAGELRQHRAVVDIHPAHDTSHYRGPSYVRQVVREPVDWSTNASREARVLVPGLDRPGVLYTSAHRDFQEPLGYAPIANPHLEQRENHFRGSEETSWVVVPHTDYRDHHQPQPQPPLLSHPSHGHYIEDQSLPVQHYTPEHHEVLYLDRRPLVDH